MSQEADKPLVVEVVDGVARECVQPFVDDTYADVSFTWTNWYLNPLYKVLCEGDAAYPGR